MIFFHSYKRSYLGCFSYILQTTFDGKPSRKDGCHLFRSKKDKAPNFYVYGIPILESSEMKLINVGSYFKSDII